MCAARDGTLPIEPLRGTENWPVWLQLIHRALTVENLRSHVSAGDRADPNGVNDARALLILYANTSAEIRKLVTICEDTSARNLYKQLETICDKRTGDKVVAYEKFLKCSYQGDAQRFIVSFRDVVAGCRICNIQISEFVGVIHFYRAAKIDFPEFRIDRHDPPCLETVMRDFLKLVEREGERKPGQAKAVKKAETK